MRYARRILLPICCFLVLFGLGRSVETSGPPPLVKVRIAYHQRKELTQLEQAGADIWEVHPGYVVAVVSRDLEEALTCETRIVPTVYPDGHVQAEKG